MKEQRSNRPRVTSTSTSWWLVVGGMNDRLVGAVDAGRGNGVFGELLSPTSYLFILVMPVIYDVLYSSTVTSFARVIISAPRPK